MEQRVQLYNFEEDTPYAPHVHGYRILSCPKQQLWCSVPDGHHLIGKWTQWHAKGSCQTEVRNLKKTIIRANKNVLWLKVSVHYSVAMTSMDARKNLPHVGLYDCWCLQIELRLLLPFLDHMVKFTLAELKEQVYLVNRWHLRYQLNEVWMLILAQLCKRRNLSKKL